MKTTKFLTLVLALCAILAASSCGLGQNGGDGANVGAIDGANDNLAVTTAEPEPMERRVSFACAGDNIVHESLYVQAAAEAAALASTDGYAKDYYFDGMYDAAVGELIAGADISFVNQECPIANAAPHGYPNFNAPKEAGDALVSLGFDIVNIANNHMLDMESATTGLADSIAYWKTKQVLLVGGHDNQADCDTIRYLEKDGVRIAVLSYTYGTNYESVNPSSTCVVPLIDDERIVSQIAEAKENADLVLVSMHWGDENEQAVSAEQKRQAKLIADAGADAVIGHHSHTVQPIEWIVGEAGNRTLVIYSLGNFISSQLYAENLVGQIVTFDIVKGIDDERAHIENVRSNPTVTHYLTDASERDSLDLEKRYDIHVYMMEDYTEGLAALHGAHVWDDFDLDDMRGYIKGVIAAEFLPDFLK